MTYADSKRSWELAGQRAGAHGESRAPSRSGHGEYRDAQFAAVHYRPPIIGPDECGSQPMPRDVVTVVFNGCICNHRELRTQLGQGGFAVYRLKDARSGT